ncbi:major facilitator superfamily domain-containing protein [Amylocarpus encephaloides]|uniref:Major facilitator superfamily domain-containing protein n=1 Tax=Amylocarpus encephaloides TaxID=45428 RepID=A0A9P7YHQ3_9HELO|nr:major facilitator superfamily domain-containing protein [Amylocarpus encephaloides]
MATKHEAGDRITPIPGVRLSYDEPVLSKNAPFKFEEQTNYVPVKIIITIFIACSTVDLLALMDQTTLASSLNIISRELNASGDRGWIAGGYFITSTAFQLLYGRLSDIWSRKTILISGLVIFFIGSLASSLAQNAIQLIIFRALTGIGGGGLVTVAQMILSDIVPLRERGKYQGILGSVVALSNGIGPVIGGALASRSENSWRWIFRLNLPLAILTLLSTIYLMPLKRVEGDWKLKLKSIDFCGIALALAGTAVVMLGLTWAGGQYSWDSVQVVSSLVFGFAISCSFILWQWRGTNVPLIPLHIFKSRIVVGACITMFVNGWNFIVQIYYIPTFYQLVYGYSAVKAGSMLLAITLTQTLFSTLSGLAVHWLGRYRESIIVGWMAWAVGLGLLSTLGEKSSLPKMIWYMVLTGFGCGQTLQPSLIAIQAGVDRADMAVVTSFRNFIRNLGGCLGLAVSGTIINNFFRSLMEPFNLENEDILKIMNDPEKFISELAPDSGDEVRRASILAYQQAFRVIFLVGAALAVVAVFVALVLMPQIDLAREDDDKLREEAKHG